MCSIIRRNEKFLTEYIVAVDEYDELRTKVKIIPFFWHIPKAAGTTFESVWIWIFQYRPIVRIGTLHELEWELSKLKSARDLPAVISSNYIFRLKPYFERIRELHGDIPVKFGINCLLRHPYERSQSLFNYLRKATHEPTYQKEWASMTFMEYIHGKNFERNWMTFILSNGNVFNLDLAKYVFSRYVIIGDMNVMRESIEDLMEFGYPNFDYRTTCKLTKSKFNVNKDKKVNLLEEKEYISALYKELTSDVELYMYVKNLDLQRRLDKLNKKIDDWKEETTIIKNYGNIKYKSDQQV